MTGPADVRSRPWARVLGVGVALVVALVAWGLLVRLAIAAGARGRDGDSSGWVVLAVAALAAVACLFLALVLGQRLVRVWHGDGRARYAGRHR